MPTKRNSKKKVQLSTDELKPYFSTPLSDCFLIDPCHPSGATHDTDIFGTYTIGPDRSIVFKQCFHSTPLFLSCKTPKDLDDMICKVLIAAAKHSHRYLVINEGHVPTIVPRMEGHAMIFANPSKSCLGKTSYSPIRCLPEKVVICIYKEEPENLGTVHYYLDTYSFSLFMPSMISVFEVVPEVFGKPIELGKI